MVYNRDHRTPPVGDESASKRRKRDQSFMYVVSTIMDLSGFAFPSAVYVYPSAAAAVRWSLMYAYEEAVLQHDETRQQTIESLQNLIQIVLRAHGYHAEWEWDKLIRWPESYYVEAQIRHQLSSSLHKGNTPLLLMCSYFSKQPHPEVAKRLGQLTGSTSLAVRYVSLQAERQREEKQIAAIADEVQRVFEWRELLVRCGIPITIIHEVFQALQRVAGISIPQKLEELGKEYFLASISRDHRSDPKQQGTLFQKYELCRDAAAKARVLLLDLQAGDDE